MVTNPSVYNVSSESNNTSTNNNNTSTNSHDTSTKSVWQIDKYFYFLVVIFYLVIWFSCGAGQLVIVVLMIINVDANDDGGVKAYGAIIIALTIIYMFASSVYSTVVFIWFYHKWEHRKKQHTKV